MTSKDKITSSAAIMILHGIGLGLLLKLILNAPNLILFGGLLFYFVIMYFFWRAVFAEEFAELTKAKKLRESGSWL